MSEQTSKPWPSVYAALFGKTLEPNIAATFEDEARRRLMHLSVGEMSNAIRLLSADAARTSEKYPPNAEDIIGRILRCRRETFLQQDRHSQCAHCHHGWMQFRFYADLQGPYTLKGVRGHVLHPADPLGGEPCSSPCKCSQGDLLISGASNLGIKNEPARTTKFNAEELRDAVWQARNAFVRNMTDDAGKTSDVADMARELEQHFKNQEVK